MSAIFISHSSQDRDTTDKVKGQLAKQGHRSVFLDFDPTDGIPPGRNWERELYTRLRGCQAVIVLCSEHSMASQWCFAEIVQARSLGKHLFPLVVASCTIPPLLRDIQVIDLTADSAEGYRRLWSGLKQAGLDPADLFDWDGSRPPYPGLLAFQEQDAAVYFGRDRAIQEAIETLNRLQRFGDEPRLALILGASGSGKSSLARAGVVPRLKRDKDRWLVLDPFRPGGEPCNALAMVLASAFARYGGTRDWRAIRETLHPAADTTNGAHLLELANDLRVAAGQHEATVLLLIDQFEELLGQGTHRAARDFLRLLREALEETSSPMLALGTLRSDFLGMFQSNETTRDLSYEPIHLQQMAVGDFARVIEEPARVSGLELVPGLTQAMVVDTATDDALPLLAFALRELWERYGGDGRLTLEEYRDGLGGLKGAVAHAAETVCRGLSADQERSLRKAFRAMVRVDEEGRYVRQSARWAELPADVHDLLERFVQARLLVSRSEGSERVLEVAHEALFRSWDRIVSWLKLDHDFLWWQQRLQSAMKQWEDTGRHESALLRGPLLAEAERRLAERADELNPPERDFIQKSVALEKRVQKEQQRRRIRGRRVRWVITGLSSMVALLFGWLWWSAIEQQQQTLSGKLTAQARNYFADQPDLGLLLSLEAYRTRNTVETRSNLLSGLEYDPRLTMFLRDHPSSTQSVAFSRGRPLLALGGGNIIVLWDVAAHKRHNWSFTIPDDESVFSVAFSQDQDDILLLGSCATLDKNACQGLKIRRWEVAAGQPHGEPLAVPRGRVFSMAFSPDSHTLALGAGGGITLWDVDNSRSLRTLSGYHKGVESSLAFSKDGFMLASGGTDGLIGLWDLNTDDRLGATHFARHEGHVNSLAFSPDGKTLAADSSSDKTIVLRNVKTREPQGRPLTGHPESASSIAFSKDGRTLAAVSGKQTVTLWDVTARSRLGQTLATTGVNSLAFSPDGRMLAAGSWLDKTIVLWDMENPQRPGRRLTGHSEGVWSLAFSRDGKTLVSSSCCNKMEIRWWEVATEKPQPTALTVPVGNVSSVAFSPDGHTLALGTKGGDIILWDIEKHERLDQQLMGHSERVRSLGFSPDGQTLASVGQETVILTDMATGLSRDRWPLTGISYEEVWSVALSLDGQTLVLGGIADRPHRFEGVDFVGTITLWDVATRQRLGPPLTWHTEVVQSVIFSADGKRLASGGKDRIMLWDVSEESWQARACRIVNRNLTPEEWRQFLGEEPYRETCPNLP